MMNSYKMFGFFWVIVNIIDLIQNIPISEFYIKTEEENKVISKNEAFELYNEISKVQNVQAKKTI